MSEASFPVRLEGGIPVIAAPEEIDITTAGLLRTTLLAAGADGRRTLVVDMSGTHFCDSAGLNVLVRAHLRAEAGGCEVRLVMSGTDVLRIFVVTGIDRLIPIFASLGDALGDAPACVPVPRAGLAAGLAAG
jgi:anti-sigma B factor antagonist